MKELLNEDCGSCKDQYFNVYIENIDKNIWLGENLSLLLYSILDLGFTKTQAGIVAESILTSSNKYKIFTGEKPEAFEVLDLFLKNGIEVSIVKKEKDIFK